MTTEQNKALARCWVEAFEKGDKATLASLCDPHVVDRSAAPGAPAGVAGLQAQSELYTTAFPNIRFTSDNVVAEGDRVAISWVATGTHTGPLMGMPPTGKPVQVQGCNILHIEAGKIVEHWAYFDRMALMAQLGAMPA